MLMLVTGSVNPIRCGITACIYIINADILRIPAVQTTGTPIHGASFVMPDLIRHPV